MARRALLLPVVLAVLAALAPAAQAGARPSACERLAGRDLAKAKAIKLVVRDNDAGGQDLFGCRLPRGRVRLLAQSVDEGDLGEQSSFTLNGVLGSWVRLTTSGGFRGGDSTSMRIIDAATGRGYLIAARSCPPPFTGVFSCSGSYDVRRVRHNDRGRAVAALGEAGGQVAVVIFNARGDRTVVDRGPAATVPPTSVTLRGSSARWRNGGQALSADISERRCGGVVTDLAPAADVVVGFRRPGEDAEPGTERELVGCVRTAGPIRVLGDESQAGTSNSDVTFRGVAGSWVALARERQNAAGGQVSELVADVRSGRSYRPFDLVFQAGEPVAIPERPVLLVNDGGQSVLLSTLGGTATLAAFSSRGVRTQLDSGPAGEIPAADVRLEGSTVRWTRAGAPRSATITG